MFIDRLEVHEYNGKKNTTYLAHMSTLHNYILSC